MITSLRGVAGTVKSSLRDTRARSSALLATIFVVCETFAHNGEGLFINLFAVALWVTAFSCDHTRGKVLGGGVEMDVLFTAEFWTALMSIVIIDLVLAGDNAIVIGLAARNLPKQDQTKVIIWGTIGAVIIRIAATMGVVYLLKIPGLLIVGGLLLIWIAIKLLVEEKEHDVKSGTSMWAAIRTIIIADAAMGLDNVLAVAGAAHGSMMLVVLGLTISVPIVVWGSTVVLKLIERFPWIIMIGSAVLGWTAAKMFVGEAFLKDFFVNPVIKYGFEAVVIAFVLVVGMIVKKKRVQEKASVSAASSEGPRHAQGE